MVGVSAEVTNGDAARMGWWTRSRSAGAGPDQGACKDRRRRKHALATLECGSCVMASSLALLALRAAQRRCSLARTSPPTDFGRSAVSLVRRGGLCSAEQALLDRSRRPMLSRWSDVDARKTVDVLSALGVSEALALRIYTTRLLG